MSKIPNYSFFSSLWGEERDKCKWANFNMWQKIGEIIYDPKGQWLKKPGDPKKTGLVINGIWCSNFNRINTHLPLFVYFCKQVAKYDTSIIIDLENKNLDQIMKKIKNLVLSNLDVYFPENEKTEESKTIQRLLDKSWLNGNIAVIGTICSLYEFDSDITSMEYDFVTGGIDDMNGTDLTVYYTDGNDTYQIKAGKLKDKKYGENYYVSGAPNSLEYTTTYYSYCSVNENETQIVVFKNVRNLLDFGNYNRSIKVHKNLIKIKETINMPIPQKISKISKISKMLVTGGTTLTLQKEGDKNYVKIIKDDDIISVIINFIDYTDKTFETELDNCISELQNLFE